jgi:hypothetical protein
MITIIFQGGLGNQLYQLSLALYLRKQGYKIALDVSNYTSNKSYHEGLSIEKLINLSEFQLIRSSSNSRIINQTKAFLPLKLKKLLLKLKHLIQKVIYKVTNIEATIWDEELFQNANINIYDFKFSSNKNYVLKGYWQDEKIVNLVLDELKSLILSTPSLKKKHLSLFNLIKDDNSVLIHFRGGDFIDKNNHKKFDILSQEYYKKSISYFQARIENPKFFIYYDDEKQMKRLLINRPDNAIILGRLSNDSVYDFYIQMNHRNFICSNSTFSWWTAKLSPNRDIALIPEIMINKDDNSEQKVVSFKLIS